MPAFFIGGGRDDVDGGLLGRLDGALLLDYDAKDEIGAVLPYRLVPSILIGGVNDVRQLAGAPLMDYDAVEGTGAVLPCRQYIEAAGREMDEESGRGFQCRLFSLAAFKHVIIHSLFVCNNVEGYNVLLLNGPRSAPQRYDNIPDAFNV